MEHEYTVRPSWTEDDLKWLAKHMRQADIDEVWAAGRVRPREAIDRSMDTEGTCGVGYVDGTPVCAFGIGRLSILNLMGIPWLLGTNDLIVAAPHFLRRSRDYILAAQDEFRLLENHVDARNTETLKWLNWLDFTVDPAEPFGPDRLPFHRFHWEAPDVF